jgi:hypothetical protein
MPRERRSSRTVIVAIFKELAGEEGSYQTLINRALHEWLAA